MSFGFDTLALLVVVGLAGPLLAAIPHLRVPVVVGELVAGVVLGKTGFGIIDHTDPTFTLFADIGFALVMFVVGTHVPLRDKQMRSSIPGALARAALVGVVAAGLGVAVAAIFGTGHAALYGVLMASSSAALALPIIDNLRLSGPPVLLVGGDLHTDRPLHIADGYHRVCASYHLDENTEIPCRLVDPPITGA